MNSTPLVSICCAVYNHEPYLKDAIEGFLMQTTSFPFEILLRDDASTDGSRNIIEEYWSNHPSTIRPIYYDENQFVKGGRPSRDWFNLTSAEYIALCEGDDYWIDKDKLQKQIDYLNAHKDYSGVFTNYQVIDSAGNVTNRRARRHSSSFFYSHRMILESGVPQTCTVVYRNIPAIGQKLDMVGAATNGDQIVAALMAEYGPIGYIDDITAVRRTGSGTFSTRTRINQRENMLRTFEKLKVYYDNNQIAIRAIQKRLDSIHSELVVSSLTDRDKSLKDAIEYSMQIKNGKYIVILRAVIKRVLGYLNRVYHKFT